MLKLIHIYIIISLTVLCLPLMAQNTLLLEEADQRTIDEIVSRNDSLRMKPIPVRMVTIGKMLLDRPYEAKTLETGKEERLVVNLRAFDCTTFLETTLALARLIPLADRGYGVYCQLLTNIRYRDGKSDSYPARLHYLTEWLYNKEQQGEMEDITQKLGGLPYEKTINFMTTHPQAYRQLADKQNLAVMQAVERNLNTHKRYYIPKAAVGKIESQLQEGDIIAITTNVKGLDVVHVGLAVLKNGHIYLLHASSDQKKVAVSTLPLVQYLQRNSGQSGIIVVRPH